MSENPIEKLFNECPNWAKISHADERCIMISWSVEGVGFGDYTFFKRDGVGAWVLDSETDGKERIKVVLSMLVDSLELVD